MRRHDAVAEWLVLTPLVGVVAMHLAMLWR